MLGKINRLEPGEKFIWADRYTRNIMIVDNYLVYRAGPCEFIEHTGNDNFSFSSGSNTHYYAYDEKCRVYLLDDSGTKMRDSSSLDYEVECVRCGVRWGSHYGLRCPEVSRFCKKAGTFVPDQNHAEVSVDWFADTLGL